MNWVEPITDRSAADVQSRAAKAFLHAKDFNRIEGNIAWLTEMLHGFHVAVNTQNRTDWKQENVPTSADIRRICENIERLLAKYFRPEGYQEVPDLQHKNLDYKDVNLLEMNLFLLKRLLDGMVGSFRQASFQSGQTKFLPKRRMG